MKSYLSLIKFSHTLFAMPFAMVGFTLATVQQPEGLSWKLLGLVVACMVFARSAAMAFNRWADREYDRHNPRTATREIPAGTISANSALFFVLLNCGLFIAATAFINVLCLALSPVALAVVLGYSYTKRFTALCHLVLGVGLGLAPVGAFVAVAGHFEVAPILLGFTVLTWVSGFDIIYALQDESFDRSQNLHSIPAALGKARALRVSELLHLVSAALVITTGALGGFGAFYWVGTAVFCGLLFYQHTLVKPDDLSRVNLAFFTSNGVASLIFGILAIADVLL